MHPDAVPVHRATVESSLERINARRLRARAIARRRKPAELAGQFSASTALLLIRGARVD